MVIRHSLEVQRQKLNSHRVRTMKDKLLPSGSSPNQFMANPAKFNAASASCLHPVDRGVVKQLMENLGGESLLQFVDPAFAAHCDSVYLAIGSPPLEPKNAWDIFFTMLPLISFPS